MKLSFRTVAVIGCLVLAGVTTAAADDGARPLWAEQPAATLAPTQPQAERGSLGFFWRGARFKPIAAAFRPMVPGFRPVHPRFQPMYRGFRPVAPRFKPMRARLAPIGARFRPLWPDP